MVTCRCAAGFTTQGGDFDFLTSVAVEPPLLA
jgi:hypothetical protein